MRVEQNNTAGYRVWGQGSFAHICLESPGCRFRKEGCCTMCNYGAGDKLTPAQIASAVRNAVSAWGQPISRLLVGTYGSVFDESEVSESALPVLLQELSVTGINDIIFETHYSTVTEERLTLLRNILPNRHLSLELGFESANEAVLRYYLKKYMNLDDLVDTIELNHSFQIYTILNVFLGTPRLSPREQLQDALHSVRWAFEHGADEVVVFPANVKPGSDLWSLYIRGEYVVPSAWLLVELLQSLSDRELEKTAISWYGDRQYAGIDTEIIPPATCPRCRDSLMKFFSSYMRVTGGKERRQMIYALTENGYCDCYQREKEARVYCYD